jgi:hypothetical protein
MTLRAVAWETAMVSGCLRSPEFTACAMDWSSSKTSPMVVSLSSREVQLATVAQAWKEGLRRSEAGEGGEVGEG